MKRVTELKKMQQQGYLPTREAAALIGMSDNGLRWAVRKKHIEAIRFYGHIYIHQDDARRYRKWSALRRFSPAMTETLAIIREFNDSTGRFMPVLMLGRLCWLTHAGALYRVHRLHDVGWIIYQSHNGCWITDAGRKVLA
jgi:hypothetical protein